MTAPPESDGRGAGVAPLAPAVRLAVLEAFFQASTDALFSQDADRLVTTWNRSAQRLFGYADTDVVGRTASFLFPERLHERVERIFDAVGDGARISHVELEVRRRDGMGVPISLSVDPVFDAEGSPVGSVAVARDITEQRLGQAVLAEADALLREGEALAHVGRWLWDVEMGAVQWSDEAHRIFGVDPLDFDGTFEAHVGCVHPDDRAQVRAAMEEALSSSRSFEDEYRIVRPDGETRWIYSRVEPTVGSSGAVVGLRGIGHDVTERRLTPG